MAYTFAILILSQIFYTYLQENQFILQTKHVKYSVYIVPTYTGNHRLHCIQSSRNIFRENAYVICVRTLYLLVKAEPVASFNL